MPSNFLPELYKSILEASDKCELMGIKNTDLNTLEIELIISN